MPIAPGTKIGPYEIQAPLGEGGMGAVYQAHDPTLQRTVAIKVLAKQDEDASARLLQEARAASALDHPNICTVYEVGEHEGRSFIAMAYVQGKPLSALIPADGLPPESVIRYGTQIADALAHAHERGVVHRDLKSANVVITPEGRAKVLDFGLAARMPQADAEAVTKTQEALPHAGMLVGTLAYMAPEVLRGEAATARSDIWALGVLLYEMASGKPPFSGTTQTDVVSAIIKEQPATLPAKVSPGLRNVIQHCLMKEPAQRYRHATAIQAALETIQSDATTTQPVVKGTQAITPPYLVAGVGLVAVLVLGLGYVLRESSNSDSARLIRFLSPSQVTTAIEVEDYPTLSPDGEMVAYERGPRENRDIWVSQIGEGQPTNRTADHAGHDQHPSWSPDGRRIAFWSDRDGGGIYVMPVLSGAPRRVVRTGLQGRPQWSPDGTEIAVYRVDEDDVPFIEIVSVEDGSSHRVPMPGTQTLARSDMSWSPDGRFIAYQDGSHGWEVNGIWLVRVDDGEAFALTDGRTYDLSPTWSADSRSVYYVSNRGGSRDLWRQRIEDDGEPTGPAEPMTAGVGMTNVSMSIDGTRLAYMRGGTVSNVWRAPILADRMATWDDAEQITFDTAFIAHFGLSPDGQRLAVSSDRAGNLDIWVLPAGGGELQPVVTDPSPDWGGQWSPGGDDLVFWSHRTGSREIWTIPVSGGAARQLTSLETEVWFPTWSPDGNTIAFQRGVAGTRFAVTGLWTVPASGGEPRQITSGGNNPSWSPDGEWIAFSGGGIHLVRPTGEDRSTLLTDGGAAAWSPDGATIYFSRNNTTGARRDVWSVSVEDVSERQITNLSGRRGQMGRYRTNAHYVYFTWQEDLGDIWVMDVVQDDGSDD